MVTSEQLNQVKAIKRRVTAWQKRAAAFEDARDKGSLSDAEPAKRGARLERQRHKLLETLEVQRIREEEAQAKMPHCENTRRRLLELRYEIGEDLIAGRMTEDEYDACNQRIEHSLRQLDEPRRPGETVRVIGIPRKKIDIQKLAMVYWMQGRRRVRERQGLPPPTEEEERQTEILWIQAQAVTREHKREDETPTAQKQEAAYQRFRRSKPPQLRKATWDWLLDQGLQELPAQVHFGQLLCSYGILDNPELLSSSVIQLHDGLDYVIDTQTVAEFADSTETVSLLRLNDRERIPSNRQTIEQSISEGPVFEQMEI